MSLCCRVFAAHFVQVHTTMDIDTLLLDIAQEDPSPRAPAHTELSCIPAHVRVLQALNEKNAMLPGGSLHAVLKMVKCANVFCLPSLMTLGPAQPKADSLCLESPSL